MTRLWNKSNETEAESQHKGEEDRLSLQPDADTYAIEKTHINEMHKIRMAYIDEYEKKRIEAGRNEIDVLQKYELNAAKETAERHAQIKRDKALQKLAELRKQIEEEEKLRYENESQLAAEKDKLTQMQQSAVRSKAESAIEGSGNIAQTDIQAISDFRTKIFEGMRAGTMSAMDYEIASIEKTYAIPEHHP